MEEVGGDPDGGKVGVVGVVEAVGVVGAALGLEAGTIGVGGGGGLVGRTAVVREFVGAGLDLVGLTTGVACV